jgi:hypothetical protein
MFLISLGSIRSHSALLCYPVKGNSDTFFRAFLHQQSLKLFFVHIVVWLTFPQIQGAATDLWCLRSVLHFYYSNGFSIPRFFVKNALSSSLRAIRLNPGQVGIS